MPIRGTRSAAAARLETMTGRIKPMMAAAVLVEYQGRVAQRPGSDRAEATLKRSSTF